jgi:hypothetical protein
MLRFAVAPISARNMPHARHKVKDSANFKVACRYGGLVAMREVLDAIVSSEPALAFAPSQLPSPKRS